jgi:hypothetical protein
MNESFLSFIWKFRLYLPNLTSTSGDPVTVISPGEQHSNSGPDFFNARIRIGETMWAGNVEIHTNASDWYRHSHQSDEAYSNVILHIVYEADCDIMLNDQRTVPTVALKGLINEVVNNQYNKLIGSIQPIPCARLLSKVPSITWQTWTDRMLVERLEQKSEMINESLQFGGGDWELAFYQVLAGGFGFHINSVPFTMLSRILPLRLLQKHADDSRLCEALAFGQAGLLSDTPLDGYQRELQEHYKFLSAKYKLQPLDRHLWKFLRMRPVNFPTIRISQFNALMTSVPSVFSTFMNAASVEDYHKILNVKASGYWEDHYVFGKPAPVRPKNLGKEAAGTLMINCIAPFLFLYGKWTGEEHRCESAFRLLNALPPEKNRIISEWELAGAVLDHAGHSQAALGLYRNYCVKKNCLNCSIGTALLKCQ